MEAWFKNFKDEYNLNFIQGNLFRCVVGNINRRYYFDSTFYIRQELSNPQKQGRYRLYNSVHIKLYL